MDPTQPTKKLKNLDPTRPNPTQPNPWVNPTHGQLRVRVDQHDRLHSVLIEWKVGELYCGLIGSSQRPVSLYVWTQALALHELGPYKVCDQSSVYPTCKYDRVMLTSYTINNKYDTAKMLFYRDYFKNNFVADVCSELIAMLRRHRFIFFLQFLPARRYASAGISYGPVSVCHESVLG